MTVLPPHCSCVCVEPYPGNRKNPFCLSAPEPGCSIACKNLQRHYETTASSADERGMTSRFKTWNRSRADSLPGRFFPAATPRCFWIPEADLPRVIERHYQASAPEGFEAGAQGFGLAIVRQFVEAHHSEVRVRSAEGRGT